MPFLLVMAAVLARFIHPKHRVNYAHGDEFTCCYLQLQVVWGYYVSRNLVNPLITKDVEWTFVVPIALISMRSMR